MEVFPPYKNVGGLDRESAAVFVADSIVRILGYLGKRQRPLFIKTEFISAEVWRQLTAFDETLIIGALGGPRKSACCTLQLARDVVANGGRAILFGRAVFEEEDPRLFCRYLRAVLDNEMNPDRANECYHHGSANNPQEPGDRSASDQRSIK